MSLFDRHIDGSATRIALVLLLPSAGLALATGDAVWLRAALVTICSFIAVARGGLTLAGSASHAIGIQLGWLLLWSSMPVAPFFGLVVAVLAAITLRFVGAGEHRRPIGLFLAVPAIYLSFQFGLVHPHASMAQALTESTILLAGSVPVLIWQLLNSRSEADAPHRAAPATKFDPAFTWPSLLVPLAVGAIAWLAVRWHVPSGQWLVWSTLVVAYGDAVASWSKFLDRAIGVALGAPAGGLAASYLQGGETLAIAAMVAALLTLVTIRRYVVAYAVRSSLVVLSMALSLDDRWIVMTRVVDVVGGGFVGIACYGFAIWLNRFRRVS